MSFHVEIGHEVTFSKTVGETDVYMFAGITGDLVAVVQHILKWVSNEA